MKSITCSLLVTTMLVTTANARADDYRAEADRTEDAAIPTPQQSNSARPMRTLPITMFVLGGAAIVGGAVAIAFDQDDVAYPAGQVQPQFYYETTTPGLIAIVSGAVFAGAGGYLYWRFGRVRATPHVRVGGDGATIGIGWVL